MKGPSQTCTVADRPEPWSETTCLVCVGDLVPMHELLNGLGSAVWSGKSGGWDWWLGMP